ncbi:MAG: hypothetical protein WBX11_04895 [Thiobacillaceae bacterium]
MSNSSKAWRQGAQHASSGKGASNHSNSTWQVRQAYVAGYKSTTKPNSGNSGNSGKSGK